MTDNQFLDAYKKPETIANLSTNINFQRNMDKVLDEIRDRARKSGNYETEESYIFKINGTEYEAEIYTRSMDINPNRDCRPMTVKINGKQVYEDFSAVDGRNIMHDAKVKECIDKFKTNIETLEKENQAIDINQTR